MLWLVGPSITVTSVPFVHTFAGHVWRRVQHMPTNMLIAPHVKRHVKLVQLHLTNMPVSAISKVVHAGVEDSSSYGPRRPVVDDLYCL
jgi:hypothetical protein